MKHHRSIAGALTLAGLTLAACGSTATSSGTTPAHQRRVLAVLGSQSGAAGSKTPTASGGISADAASGVMRPVQWPPTFVVDGTLPSLAKEAKVYTLKGGDEAAIAKVAQAFGVTGPVTKSPATADGFDQWEVVSGTSHLTVNGTAGFSWYLYDSADASGSVSSGCAGKPIVSPPDISTTDQSTTTAAGSAVDTTLPGCVIVPPTPPADRPTSDEAKRIALTAASSLGIDVTNAAVRVDDSYTTWSVAIDPQLGGLPTQGYGLYLGIGSKGKIVYGSGFIASASVLDTYPLVTPADGLTRLTDQNYVIGGGPYPVAVNAIESNPLAGMSSGSGAASTPSAEAAPGYTGTVTTTVDTPIVSTTLATVPGPTTTLAPWVVHITGARLVLVPRWISPTEMLLVPAYEYTTTEGSGTWMAIAVSGDFLTQAPPMPTPGSLPASPTPEPPMTAATTGPAITQKP